MTQHDIYHYWTCDVADVAALRLLGVADDDLDGFNALNELYRTRKAAPPCPPQCMCFKCFAADLAKRRKREASAVAQQPLSQIVTRDEALALMAKPLQQPRKRRKGKGGVNPTHDWPLSDQEAECFSLAYRRAHRQLPDKRTLVDYMEEWWAKQKTTPRRKVIARELPKQLYRDE